MQTTVQPKMTVISNRSGDSAVVTSANVANVRSQILEVTAKLGQFLIIPNRSKVKDYQVRGHHFILDLRDAGNNRIPASSLFIYTQTPADEMPVGRRRISTSIWGDLDTTQQRNDDFKGGIAQAIDLNVDEPIVLAPDHKLILELQGGTVVSWANSYIEFRWGEVNQ